MVRVAHKPKAETWGVGDRVTVSQPFNGVPFSGEIMKANERTKVAFIHFDDGDELQIDFEHIQREDARTASNNITVDENGDSDLDDDDSPSFTYEPPPDGQRGMHHYPITWSKDATSFTFWAAPDKDDLAITEAGDKMIEKLKDKQVKFYGWWRKTEFRNNETGVTFPGWSIDIYAELPKDDGKIDRIMVESIPYESPKEGYDPLHDPRNNMHSLNSDICAAIRKWFFLDLKGDRLTVIALRKRAERPIIEVPSLQWLDMFLLKAREVRDTALRSGGQRTIVLDTGIPEAPVVSLNLNFTNLAIAADGKPPNLYVGAMLEQAHKSGGKKSGPRPQRIELRPDPNNVSDLSKRLKQLNDEAKGGNANSKKEAKKIRAAMRKMGHVGGSRLK